MERPVWAPAGIDLDRPSSARVYDYVLGGSHNVAVDRELGDRMIAMAPDVPVMAQENRAFLRRAVRYAVGSGVHQFLDIGSGIPTVGTVHEVALAAEPAARVAYVDIDPVAVIHSSAILAEGGIGDQVVAVQADLRRPGNILGDPQVRALIDFDRPVAVLVVSMLHFLPDADDPAALLRRFTERLVPGSLVALSHTSADLVGPEVMEPVAALYRSGGIDVVLRTRAQIGALLAGLDLVDPGVVPIPQWRPEPGEEPDGQTRISGYAAVGRTG